jgi:D-alanyl-D-alanine carboxypeptidase (penicillin-binding protein 5/6)
MDTQQFLQELKTRGEVKKISNKMLAVNGGLVAVALLALFSVYGAVHRPAAAPTPVAEAPAKPTAFDSVTIGAKAAYVYDLAEQKVLYRKNEFAQLPLASLTKLMMAYTATELLPKDSKITIKKEFLEEDGDSGLLVNESWKLSDLLDFSLVVSSNDGARAIASVIGATDLKTDDYDLGRKDFINKMNLNAKALGLKQTYFVNESGLDVGEVSGGYGSAIDVANLLAYMLKNTPDVLEATKDETITVDSLDAAHTGKNTNIDIGKIPGLLASKTGFTDMAGGNLAVAFDTSIGHPIIAVVLGSTEDGRFSDISALVNASFAYASSSVR